MSKTFMKMFSFVEADILQGTAGICLQGEIEMLVFNIALISQSMNKLHAMVFFFLWLLLMFLHAQRALSAYNVQICEEFVLVLNRETMEVMFIYLFFQFDCTDLGNRR